MGIQPTHIDTLKMLMNASMMRQQAISQNIANVNTPGYHRKDVQFEAELAERLVQDPAAEPSPIQPQMIETEGLTERENGNNVDIDQEIGALNKNSTMYQLYAQVLSSKIRMMHAASRGQA